VAPALLLLPRRLRLLWPVSSLGSARFAGVARALFTIVPSLCPVRLPSGFPALTAGAGVRARRLPALFADGHGDARWCLFRLLVDCARLGDPAVDLSFPGVAAGALLNRALVPGARFPSVFSAFLPGLAAGGPLVACCRKAGSPPDAQGLASGTELTLEEEPGACGSGQLSLRGAARRPPTRNTCAGALAGGLAQFARMNYNVEALGPWHFALLGVG